MDDDRHELPGESPGERLGHNRDAQLRLIRAARAGDARAFEELVLSVRDRIFWVAYQVVGNAEDAKDVAQNVLVRLWRMLPRYDEKYTFTTWLYRMTMNLAIDSLRRGARRRAETELDDALVQAAPAASGEPAGPGPDLAEREVQRIFHELKECLPGQQRAVFVLREMEGLSSEEVAAALGLTSSTVRNHLFQARRRLKLVLAERYPEYLPRGGRSGADSSGATDSERARPDPGRESER